MMDRLAAEILFRLAEQPDYAYNLRRRVEQFPDGINAPNATFYRQLRWLLKNELIDEIDTPEGEDQRRQYYRINAGGHRALGNYAAGLVDQLRRLEGTVLPGITFGPTEIYTVARPGDWEGVLAVYDSPEQAIEHLEQDDYCIAEAWANTNTGERARRWTFYYEILPDGSAWWQVEFD